MLLATEYGRRNFRPLALLMSVHLTQFESSFEESHHMLVNLLFGDQSLCHRLGQFGICLSESTFHVGTGDDALSSCMLRCG